MRSGPAPAAALAKLSRWRRERRTSRARVWIARGLAIAADLLQIVLFPLFLPGAASPWSDALDLAVAGAMTFLLGWHWAFLPSLVAEVVPGLDLVPTWTAAAFFVTRGSGRVARGKVRSRRRSWRRVRQDR